MTARDHAVLLCRVAGLRKAANEVGVLGGHEEMERLLGLHGVQLREECRAVPAHLRRLGGFALEDALTDDPDARIVAVVGLFVKWVFSGGARQLGVEETWGDLLLAQEIPAKMGDGKPASTFALDGVTFSATDIFQDLVEARSSSRNTSELTTSKEPRCRILAAWWHLIWQQSCMEVRRRYGLERRCLQMSESKRQKSEVRRAELEEQLAQLRAEQDYKACQAVKEKLTLEKQLVECVASENFRDAAVLQVKLQPVFEFCMEEL